MRHRKKQENVTWDQKKKHSIEILLKMAQMLKLSNGDFFKTDRNE